MELYIFTGSPDLSSACATTEADLALLIAAIADPGETSNLATLGRIAGTIPALALGDSEPLTLHFYSSAGTYADWAADISYGVTVGLGLPDPLAGELYTATTSFTVSGSSRVGRLSLDTLALRDAVQAALGQRPRQAGGTFVLHVRYSTPGGYPRTLALQSVFVAARVLSSDPIEVTDAPTVGVVPVPAITSLTGGGATALDGYDDTDLPTGFTILLSYGRVGQTWQIFAGTDATDVSATPAIVRVSTYGALNQRVWVQLG